MDYQKLLDAIQADYNQHCDDIGLKDKNMNLQVHIGRKYAKICRNHGQTAWGFVQLEDCAKFKKGDLFQAATWHTPAKNRERGNIITGDLSKVQWWGLEYLNKGAA